MDKLEIFCVTDVSSKLLEKLNLNLVGVGKKKFSKKYISVKKGINIQKKEKHYSELTFHYWFWKNKIKEFSDDDWIGFCQRRRFWLNSRNENLNNELEKIILKDFPSEWINYDAVICEPIKLGTKLMKLLKRGWRNLLSNPKILFNLKSSSIKLHFDMHHGYGVLDKAIDVLREEDREEFRNYVNTRSIFFS